jgi:hypothetical protein
MGIISYSMTINRRVQNGDIEGLPQYCKSSKNPEEFPYLDYKTALTLEIQPAPRPTP